MAELYSLPDGWEWKKLGKIAKLQNGFAFKSKLFVNDGLPIVRIKNIKNEKVLLDDVVYFNVEDYGKKLDSYQIKKNDILIAMSGATTGKIGLYDTEEISYLNQRVGLFRIENSNLRSYLFYFLSTQIEKNLELSLGAAQPNLSTEQINNIELPLPPLEEQKRIVAKLDNLFAKIDKAIALHQNNIDEADIFMASVLNDVFVELEEKYEKKYLKDIVDNYDGKRIPIKSSDRENINGIYPYYGASGIIDYVNDYIFDGEYLLISEDGANLTVRKYPIAFIAIGKFWVNNHAHIVTAKKGITTNKFMEYAFAFTDISDYITGSAQPKMSQGKMNIIEFAVPPLPTQQKVVAYLDEISNKMEKIKQIQKEKMQSLKELKASILDKAFKGEL